MFAVMTVARIPRRSTSGSAALSGGPLRLACSARDFTEAGALCRLERSTGSKRPRSTTTLVLTLSAAIGSRCGNELIGRNVKPVKN